MARDPFKSNLVAQLTFPLIGLFAAISLDRKLKQLFPQLSKDWDALPASSQEGWKRLWSVILGTSIFFIGIAKIEQAIKPKIQTQPQPEESSNTKECPLNLSFSGLYCLVVNSELLKLAETFSIIVAAWIFILDRKERRAQAHRENWSLIDGARDSETSGARYSAIESLHRERVSLRGLDAEGADLYGIQLPGANLERANLQKTDLQKANLVGANLRKANLQDANLQESNLEGADLWLVDLRGADLKGAIFKNSRLSAAKLHRAVMRKAVLEGADLRGARFYDTDFRDANLKDADIKEAEFARVKNLTFAQIKVTKNWQNATFAKDVLPENSELPRKELSDPPEQHELVMRLNELRTIENLVDEISQKRTLSTLELENYLKNNSFEIPEVNDLKELILALEDLQELKKKEFEDLCEDVKLGLDELKRSGDYQ